MTKNKPREDRLVAALSTFHISYGGDETNLIKWQQLCEDCGVIEGRSITQCKASLRKVSINIWDLIAARQTGNPVRRYANKAALRLDLFYNPKRRFPLRTIKEGGEENKFLKALLVTIS